MQDQTTGNRVDRLWRRFRPATAGDAERLLLGVGVGLMLAILSGVAVVLMDKYLGVRSPSMTFLCSVILAASWFGQRVGLATALMAFGVYNFYLTEPTYSFSFAGPDDLLTLMVFVGVALLIGNIAGRLHDDQVRARQQADVSQTLFALSRSMAERPSLEESLADLANGACKLGAAEAVVFMRSADGCIEVARSPPAARAPAAVHEAAAAVLASEGPSPRECQGWRLSGSIEGGGEPMALLAWRPSARPIENHDIALGLLVDLGRTSIARQRSIQQRVEMESLAATEKLRSALMASMSHDFRTPLATIMASASSLQAQGERFSPATRADLLTSIQEEAERLSRFVGNILDMTRLDADALHVRAELTDPIEVIEAAASRVSKRLGGRRLIMEVPAAVPSIRADRILMEQAITNVLENAISHTKPTAAIRLGCDDAADTVIVWVEDDGPGVPPAELSHIFDKFYRIDNPSNAGHGAGLGLAISKGFIEAMGAGVTASRAAQSETGLRIAFAFPRVMVAAQ